MIDVASDAADIRPVVATAAPGNWGLGLFLAVLAIGGLLLFNALRSNDNPVQAPNLAAEATQQGGRISAPPPLQLPLEYAVALPRGRDLQPLPPVILQREAPRAASGPPVAPPRSTPFLRAEPSAAPTSPGPAQPSPTQTNVVFEGPRPLPVLAASQGEPDGRVTASRLANPSMTVPQGTVIPAVLETAFDSTRPGGVRALVQRDIHGFDGSRVLIPRGSRLYGTYEAGINPGERRALIRWTRLLRPDGVTIALDSPASDPLGRAGVEGDVDSRFFDRFGGALLQSILDLGVGAATSEAGGVIVALPGSAQTITQGVQQQQQVRPVLRVPHGASVSVFVERDLDFSSVER